MKSRSLSLKTRILAIALTTFLPLGFSAAKDTKTSARQTAPQKNVKKKVPPPPISKKNLKKGKNTDTVKKSAVKSKPKKKIAKAPIKLRPSLPTQTRAEMLQLKAAETAKLAATTKTEIQNTVMGPNEANTTGTVTAAVDAAAPSEGPNEIPADAPISDADLSAGGEEVVLDLGAEASNSWNPYTFGRSSLWFILPLFSLMIIGLHLLPVPKRIYPKRLTAVPDFLQLKDKTRSIIRPKKSAGDSSNV